MNHLCIIDAHSFIYKFYFTVGKRPFINSKNQDVTLLHMFTQKVLSILSKYRPTHIVIAFDEKGPTFRNEIYPKYKANRDKAPEEINRQTPILKELLSALGFAILSYQGYEADDMIALATKVALENGFEVSIFTQDKDLLQLVGSGVKVVSMKKGEDADIVYDEKMVNEVWQIKPSQIVDFLTLMGDSSDNVPGVKGIGEKTALELIKKYGSIDQLLKYTHTIPSASTAQKLKDGIEDIKLSKSLVDLSQSKALVDLKDKVDIQSWKVPENFGEKGLAMLLQYELKQLYETISGLKYEGPYEYNRIDPSDYHLVDSKDKIERLFNYLTGFEYITIDTETTGLDLEELDILGVSFCAKEKEAYYVDLRNDSFREFFFIKFQKFLRENKKLIGQNMKFDYKVLKKYGITMKTVFFDTMIAAMLCGYEGEKLSMDDLAEKYLRYKTVHYEDIVKDKNKNLADYPVEQVKDYSCEDADITFRLYNFYKPKIVENGFEKLFYDIEMPLLPILSEMELEGILIDRQYFEMLDKKVTTEIEKIKNDIFQLAGEPFLLNSPKQLAVILFEKLKLPVLKKTKTGLSTDEDVLEELAEKGYEIAKKILIFRKYDKLKGTYIIPLMRYQKKDGRIHTTFKQAYVATGRLSSADPNLQNIPAFDELGISIRKGFIPENHFKFVSFDYSQIELRVLAYFAQEPNLLNAFNNGFDIHSNTASILFKKKLEDVSEYDRKIAKTINFGVIYGLSPFGLKQQLGISQAEAQMFINNYFATYSSLKSYIESYCNLCESRGYADTFFGRKRYISKFASNNKTDKDAARRVALNTQIQGTAAEIMKKGMIDVMAAVSEMYSDESREKARLLLQVHDELIFEVREDIVEPFQKRIEKVLENVMIGQSSAIYKTTWNVPLVVHVTTGDNWAEI